MTLLIASTFAETVHELDVLSGCAWSASADAVEVRIDCFGDLAGLNQFLKQNGNRTWLVTCRSQSEGGRFPGDGDEAALRALAAVENTSAWIDVELAAWRASGELRAKAKSHLNARPSPRLILSAHFHERTPAHLDRLVEEALREGPQIVAKVAYVGTHISDSFGAIDLIHRFGPRVIAICMGEAGAWTRVMAKKLGAFATFASLGKTTTTAPGQWSVEELRENFGWDRIEAGTKVFGVVGDPIGHSLSPRLFSHWLQQHKINAVFVPLRVGLDRGGLLQFLTECQSRPWLGLGGLSVTIPHKRGALTWAGEAADPMSRAIGAANTLVLGDAGPGAYNTDCYAAVDSLAAALDRRRNELAGLTVDVLGAGGAARAVCYGLAEMGSCVTVFARRRRDAKDFERWGLAIREWGERLQSNGEVLINCTPVGMWPSVEDSPMPAETLQGRKLVFDLIYRPLKTKLLDDAAAAGCLTLSGLDMFVRQAATQFALWTGISPDTASAQKMLADFLRREATGKQCVVLIGARGSGKSTVGALLAKLLGCTHVDTDEMVAAASGQTISQIFEREGESGFRSREAEAIQSAIEFAPPVMSFGGGAVLEPRNIEAVRKVGRIVWLAAPPEVLARRVSEDMKSFAQRPRLTANDALSEMQEVIRLRESLYRAAADFIVDTSQLDAADVARLIADWMVR